MKRVPELDSLRGFAALLIVVYHVNDANPLFFGWAALDFFFVLSGFLITSIILQRGTDPLFLMKFYARRSLRIWPIYYLTILAFVAVNPFLKHSYQLNGLIYYFTYTQNISQYFTGIPIKAFCNLPLSHTWTLATVLCILASTLIDDGVAKSDTHGHRGRSHLCFGPDVGIRLLGKSSWPQRRVRAGGSARVFFFGPIRSPFGSLAVVADFNGSRSHLYGFPRLEGHQVPFLVMGSVAPSLASINAFLFESLLRLHDRNCCLVRRSSRSVVAPIAPFSVFR